MSALTDVVDELAPTPSRPTLAGVEGQRCRTACCVDQLVTQQTGDNGDAPGQASPTTRGFRVDRVLVRVTPTGLLAGSSATKTSGRTAGRRSPSRATGAGTTYVYAEAAKKGEKAQSGVSSANLFRVRVR